MSNKEALHVIRNYSYLLNPNAGFAKSTDYQLMESLKAWSAEQQRLDSRPPIMFHYIPPDKPDFATCRRMWAVNTCYIVQGESIAAKYLEEIVNDIITNQLDDHPDSCPCKLQDHPWRYQQDMAILEPLAPAHMPGCHCKGFRRCIVSSPTSPEGLKRQYSYYFPNA